MQVEHAVKIIDEHGRDVLRKHFGVLRGCIPAARMVQEFCRASDISCVVHPVLCVVRNGKAMRRGVWPWDDRGWCKVELVEACCVVLGSLKGGPRPKWDSIDIHVVPVIDGKLIDLTLDGHTDVARFNLRPLPTVVMPFTDSVFGRGSDCLTATVDGFDCDITYWRTPPDYRFRNTEFWKHFWLLGGRRAVDELLELSRCAT